MIIICMYVCMYVYVYMYYKWTRNYIVQWNFYIGDKSALIFMLCDGKQTCAELLHKELQ